MGNGASSDNSRPTRIQVQSGGASPSRRAQPFVEVQITENAENRLTPSTAPGNSQSPRKGVEDPARAQELRNQFVVGQSGRGENGRGREESVVSIYMYISKI